MRLVVHDQAKSNMIFPEPFDEAEEKHFFRRLIKDEDDFHARIKEQVVMRECSAKVVKLSETRQNNADGNVAHFFGVKSQSLLTWSGVPITHSPTYPMLAKNK